MTSKSVRTAGPPGEEAREAVLTLLRSTNEPLTARALGRLLPRENRIAGAALATLLEEFVAAGRLIRLPAASARAQPRYWDRDIGTMLRSAALEAIGTAHEPMTSRELIPRLGLPFKAAEKDLVPILCELVAQRAVHAIFPVTSKGKPRYWQQDAEQFARQALREVLIGKGPQSEQALKKSIKGISSDLFRQVLETATAEGVLWQYPPLGKSKKVVLGPAPPSPGPYLRDVGIELQGIVTRLTAAGVSPESLRRSIVEMLEAAGVGLASEHGVSAPAVHPRGPSGRDLIGLIRRLEPGADRGALVSTRELRRAAQLEKSAFDRALLELARQGRLSLHRHDYAASLSPSERDDLVTDGAGTYYVGAALRQGFEQSGSCE